MFLSLIAALMLCSFSNAFRPVSYRHRAVETKLLSKIRGVQIFGFLGIAFTMISLIKREPWIIKKWIGVILNTILFLIIFGSIAFYYFLEMTK